MTFPKFPYGSPATVVNRVRNGQDADGNDAFTTISTVVSGVVAWPTGSTELLGAQDFADTTMTALLPSGTNVTMIDKITLNGLDYEVDGDPNDFTASPLTGNGAGIEVRLKRWTG